MEQITLVIGELISDLRKQQNLTQIQLAAGIMSKNTLASIEYGRSRVTFQQLLLLLDKLNITITEFSLLLPSDLIANKRKNYISSQLAEVYYSHDQSFESLITEAASFYQETGNIFFLLFERQAQLLADREGKISLTRDEKQVIKDFFQKYLGNFEVWHTLQWVVFINCMYLFDSEFIYFNLKQGIRRLNSTKFEQPNTYFKEHFQVLLTNGLFLFLRRGDLKLARQLLQISIEQKTSRQELYLKVMLMFCEGVLEQLETQKVSPKIDAALQIFTLAGESQQVTSLNSFLIDLRITNYAQA